MLVTPPLIQWGLAFGRRQPEEDGPAPLPRTADHLPPQATVFGLGPVGRNVASRFETQGYDVGLVDRSPLNLVAFAQQGFRTATGDGHDPQVLETIEAHRSRIVAICLPDDEVACQLVEVLRRINPETLIVVRCRFVSNQSRLKALGAHAVVSEEAVATLALTRKLDELAEAQGDGR